MFKIKIADIIVEVDNIHSYIQEYCKDWLCDGTPNFRVKVTSQEINNYIGNCGYETTAASVERILLCRKLAAKLTPYHAFLLHGGVIEYGGKGIIFCAKRGVGKTTHINLWKDAFGDSVNVVNGDKPILKRTAKGYVAYSTPWRGKEGYGGTGSVKLDKLCFIKRADKPSVEKITAKQAWTRMCRQTVYPENSADYDKFAADIAEFLNSVDIYVISVNQDIESATEVRNRILTV
ncbi:MAG: hypothetical protein E7667_03120 [Ruminococcaceae bacterium]|nr:hypothetical protein [Oscillospiraceae bacterium]